MTPDWNRIYETPLEGIFGLAIQSISIIILCSSLIHFFSVTILSNTKLPSAARYMQILCISCFVLSIIYCASNLTFHSIVTFTIHIDCKYRSWTIFFLLLQRVCLYWFYLLRIHITFERSSLYIQRRYIAILCILSSTTISITAGFAYYYHTRNECTDSAQIKGIIPGLLLDIFWCLFLSIWFVIKLKQTIVEFHNDEEKVNQKMVLLMCKLTNIVVWSSLLLQIGQWIFAVFTGWIISAVTINVVICCIALLLTFTPYSILYETYICCLCHQCVIKCCKVKIEGHIKYESQILKMKKSKQMEQQNNNNDDNAEKQSLKDPDSPLVQMIEQNIVIPDEHHIVPYHD